jgi:hypothetical protein
MKTIEHKNLYVDSSVGGRGDVWMRLIGFYACAQLRPGIKIHLLVPDFIKELAISVFRDRLIFVDQKPSQMKLTYTAIGIRSLLLGIVKGERYIAPFVRVIIAEKKRKQFKDSINLFLFGLLDKLGLVHVPPDNIRATFHGYLETAGIKMLRDISLESFSEQVNKDYSIIFERLNGEIKISTELKIPEDVNQNIVFFANGNSRQFAPLWWAKQNFPDAYYAFFHLEQDYLSFKDAGLKVIPFYKEVGDIVAIAKNAKWVVCTDSFSSHVLQSAKQNCTVLITEVVPSRVVSPAFKGPVVDNEVACHPCIHSHRSIACEAGLFECLNWKNDRYTENIKKSIPQ